MSEDEKKAIEYLKRDIALYHWNTQLASEYYAQIILNLIEKQQNELQQEKEKNKELSEELTDRICKNVEAEVFEEMRLELKQEKENRRLAEHNYDELTKTTGRLKTELEEEKKKVRTTIIGRIDQVSLDDLIGDKYISKDKIKTLKENFNKKQSSFMYRSK